MMSFREGFKGWVIGKAALWYILLAEKQSVTAHHSFCDCGVIGVQGWSVSLGFREGAVCRAGVPADVCLQAGILAEGETQWVLRQDGAWGQKGPSAPAQLGRGCEVSGADESRTDTLG